MILTSLSPILILSVHPRLTEMGHLLPIVSVLHPCVSSPFYDLWISHTMFPDLTQCSLHFYLPLTQVGATHVGLASARAP